MPINGRRPFTEMFEVTQNELVREGASNQEAKYKGFINQVYCNELPSLLPEEYIKKEGFITTLADYTAGSVTVGSATAGFLGSGTTWTSAYDNAYIKVNGYNQLFRVSFSADTLLNFRNSLTWIEASGTGLGYHLFQDRYQLASDFAYMWMDDPNEPNAVSRQVNYVPLYLDPLENQDFQNKFSGIIGDLYAYTVKWISEVPYLILLSAPSVADFVRYEYIPQLTTLTEYTTGTITLTTGTAVIGAGGMLWTTNINTAINQYYLRNDADGTGSESKWFKIATVTNDTALSLSSAFGGTSGAGVTYTVSEISKWPARFDDAILYKAALLADPDNVQMKKWEAVYQESVNLDRIVEGKRKTSRQTKQFFGMRQR